MNSKQIRKLICLIQEKNLKQQEILGVLKHELAHREKAEERQAAAQKLVADLIFGQLGEASPEGPHNPEDCETCYKRDMCQKKKAYDKAAKDRLNYN